jgi:hypothetical protein
MTGLVCRSADMSPGSVCGMPDAGTYSDMMKPYSAKGENYQGNSPTDQAR